MTNTQIMVVEDEWIIADDIQASLKKLGYAVSSIVSSGEDAIQKAREDMPDLILMDIVLQGQIDGVEAAKQIRQEFNIPVIFLTAFADKLILERAKTTGPFGYLIKPFEDRELQSNIEMALYKHKMERKVRESEEKHRKMIEAAQDAIICVGEEGNVNVWNKAAENIFGYSKDEIIDQPILTIIPEKYKSKHQAGLKRFLQTGKTKIIGKTVEVAGKTKSGHEVPIEMSLSFHESGEKQYTFTAIIRDITSQKETNEQLIEKSDEIEKINKELSEFIYTVSHDLKEPLFTIEGYTKRLAKVYSDKFDEKGKLYLERIKANIEKMSSRIYEIMEVLKIGTVKHDYTNNDCGEIVNDIVDMLDSKIKNNKIKLTIQDNLPTIRCDIKRMKDLFLNLFTNAIKFMDDNNEKEIKVGYEEDGKYYKFFVEDTGIGIQAEHQEHIFKIFTRLKIIEREGSGVGLAIVKKIIDLHKGDLWVESPVKDERGTRFCFTIPIPKK